MIEAGWDFVWAAYAVTLAALTILVLAVAWRALYWERQARKLDRRR